MGKTWAKVCLGLAYTCCQLLSATAGQPGSLCLCLCLWPGQQDNLCGLPPSRRCSVHRILCILFTFLPMLLFICF